MPATKEEIIKQIEYYLSDNNLQRDKFFHDLIKQNEDGFIDIEFFLKCNKVKNMGISKDDIIKAMADSSNVDLKGEQIRRKDNKTLPDLIVKKVKTEQKNDDKKEESKQQQPEQVTVKVTKPDEPIVFSVTVVVNNASMHWKLLNEVIQKTYNIKPIYIRYNKVNSEGNFILDKKTTEQSLVDKMLSEGIKVGKEFEAKITIAEGAELEEFYNLHGSHYDNCMELQALNKTSFSEKKKKQAEKREKRRKAMILFAGEKYFDISQLKNTFKGILGRTSNKEKIKEPYHEMLVELLKYHPKQNQKLQELDHFTCDIHPEYKETRCYFVVKKDGSQEDFSFTKCIAKIQEEKEKQNEAN